MAGIPLTVVFGLLMLIGNARGWRSGIVLSFAVLFGLALAGTALGAQFEHIGTTVVTAVYQAGAAAVNAVVR